MALNLVAWCPSRGLKFIIVLRPSTVQTNVNLVLDFTCGVREDEHPTVRCCMVKVVQTVHLCLLHVLLYRLYFL